MPEKEQCPEGRVSVFTRIVSMSRECAVALMLLASLEYTHSNLEFDIDGGFVVAKTEGRELFRTGVKADPGDIARQMIQTFNINEQHYPSVEATIREKIYTPIVPPDRLVVLSSDASFYCFYLPFVVRAWREMAGFRSIIFLVGAEWRDPQGRCSVPLEYLLGETDAMLVFVQHSHVSSRVMAQVIRLYAGALIHVPEHAYLLTADADLLPLSREHFFGERDFTKSMHAYNYGCCPSFQVTGHDGMVKDLMMMPLSFVGATGRTWNQIMRTELMPQKHMAEYVARHLRAELGDRSFVQKKFNQKDKMGNYSRLWFHDQYELTLKVNDWYCCVRDVMRATSA